MKGFKQTLTEEIDPRLFVKSMLKKYAIGYVIHRYHDIYQFANGSIKSDGRELTVHDQNNREIGIFKNPKLQWDEALVMVSGLNEAVEMDKEEYKKYFDSMLKKYNVNSPAELSKEDKKKFYDEIDKKVKADKETD